MSKLNFDAKVKNAVKNIVSKTEIGNVLDLRDKNKKKKKKRKTLNIWFKLFPW